MQGQVRYNVILHCSKENCIIKHSDKLRRMLSVSVMSLSLKLEMVSIYLAGESFYVLHKFIYVLK